MAPGREEESEEKDFVVRLRGLPWQATEEDIKQFFQGINLAPDGQDGVPSVLLALSGLGRPTGEAYVHFATEDDFVKALERNREKIGHRYIEVFQSTNAEMQRAQSFAKGSGGEGLTCAAVVRLRGLPFSATEADVYNFFERSSVRPMENGVHVVIGRDGRVTGEAYVQFSTEEDAKKALSKHREQMGSRYIEVFRSSKNELFNYLVQHEQQEQQVQQLSALAAATSDTYASGREAGWDHASRPGKRSREEPPSEWIVRMRGLPFSATEADVQEWLADSSVRPRSIHVLYHPSGRPAGEAYVELRNEADWNRTLDKDRETMGSRYIEIFQATSAEMLLAIANSPSPSQSHRRSSQPYQQAQSGQHFAQGLSSHYAQQPYLPPGPQSVGLGNIGSSGINLANQATAATMGAGLQSMIGFGTSNTMGVGAPLGLGNMGISGLDPALGTLLQLTALAQQSLPTTGAPLSQLDMMMNPAAAASYSMGGSSVAPSSWTSSPAAALSSLNTLYGTMAAHLSTPLASTAAAGGAGSTTGVWSRPQQGATTAAATGYAPSAQGLPSSTYPSYTISSSGGYGSVPQQTSYPITSSASASYAAYQPPVSAAGAASSAATSYSSSRPYQSQRDQSEPQITSGMTLRMRGVPFRSKVSDITEFFRGYDVVPGSVHIGRDASGSMTGEAWVSFRTGEEAHRALREKDRAHMGSRYVELFMA